MEVVGLVSGGKDSCYAMMKCIQYSHKIVALANLLPVDDSIDELDSYMYQTVGHQIVVSYAECMGLPLFRRRIQGSTRHQHLNYTETPGDEVEDLFILLNEVKQQIPSISAVSSGAIASDYQRLRVESVCSRLGLVSLAYLWKQDQCLLLQEMVMNGIKAITIKVAAMGLNPAKHLGKEIAQLQTQLLQLKESYGINVCGEGGEYETLTLDCALFKNAQIVIDDFQIVLHSPDPIAPVGILHPTSFHLEYKKDHTSFSNSDASDCSLMTMGHVFEVKGDGVSTSGLKSLPADLASDVCTSAEAKLCFSRTKKDTFSICCWIQEPPGCSDELQNDLTAVLKKIEIQLHVCGFDWCDVLYIHLYIANMNDFASANETYVNFITEKKCTLGVPSRSTIELPLTEVGLGKAYVEVLVANDRSKKVLHVQSISSWAPSCIGPYSQATMHKEILHMAGQLGLDPPTMLLCSGGALMEMEQALDNSEAVAHCFGCSLASSAILFVIYCSTSLTLSERINVQNMLEGFLRQRQSTPLQNRGMSKEKDPLFIFVLVPNLPKRALVEIKPVLHVPEDMENVAETEDREHFSAEKSYWGFEHEEWHDSCCQKYVIPGKLCSLVASVSNESASKICSESDQGPPVSQCFGTEAQMKRVARFCIYLLDGILMENNFCWGDLMNLRIYFATSLCLAADVLSLAFAEAFKEFAEMNGRMELSNVPFFNLVPVLGSGRSASMSDLITCELFASKL